jgi:hypothetical protein
MAVENAGIMAFVLGNRVVAIPVMGQASKKRFQVIGE